MIDPFMQKMIDMGAKNISDRWVDSRGGYVITVDFGENQTCEAVSTNRVAGYQDAVMVAKIKASSLGLPLPE